MAGFGHKFFAAFLALMVLAAGVVCPCAVAVFGGSGRAVMSCCEHRNGGQPGKDLGDSACKAFCSTRVFDSTKSVAVDVSPTHFVGLVGVPVVIGHVGVVPVRGWVREMASPRVAGTSLLQLHCALLV